MTEAFVKLWGRKIGAVAWSDSRDLATFEYTPEFLRAGVEVAPLTMPVRPGVFEFPQLSKETFKGLPGLLADSLPDKFGNLLINSWLAEQGRSPDSINPVERLCYIGARGMGALEFEPAADTPTDEGGYLDIASLVELAARVVSQREKLAGNLSSSNNQKVLRDILRVGTSAGGARAKAVLAWNRQTDEFRSGQLSTESGFTHWLLKFDGVSGNADKELADPLGYGRLEYACYLLACEAGIEMAECRLHEEGGRAHFMTRRFDRTANGTKLHMQSLCAMRHFDFNIPRAYSYEQSIETARMLKLPQEDIEQQVRRALVNIVIRNQDDHVKNIAYLMNQKGEWRLAPAYDVVYAHNPNGSWTNKHQMQLSGKVDQFTQDDLLQIGRLAGIKPARMRRMIGEVLAAAGNWATHAQKAGVSKDLRQGAYDGFRLSFD